MSKNSTRLSTTALVLVLSLGLTAPALAQDAAPASGDAAASNGDEIVVSGIRRSLEDAIKIKRESATIGDAISAEDIGKFPDQNLAESLQRITGVQITRSRGEGSAVSVRGLSPDFTRTQYNGRTITTTTGSRSFAFTSLTSDFVGSVEVAKTPSADMIDGGLSATINVSSSRPLDIGKDRIALTAEGIYESNPKKMTPHVSVLVNKVLGDGVFGINAGVSYERRRVQVFNYAAFGMETGKESTRTPQLDYNLDGDFADTFRFNHAAGLSRWDGESDRFTAIGGIQVRPTENLELYADVFHSTYNQNLEVGGQVPRFTNIAGPNAAVRGSAIDSNGNITFLDVDGVDLRNNGREVIYNDTTTSVAVGGKWTSGNLVVSTELTHSYSKRLTSALGLETLGRASASYDIRNDPSGIATLEFHRGYDPLNPANFNAVGFNGNYKEPVTDRNKDARLDLRYDFDQGFLKAIKVGGIVSDRLNVFRSSFVLLSAQAIANELGLPYQPNIEGGSFNAAQFMQRYSYPSALSNYNGAGVMPTTFLVSTNDLFYQKLPLERILQLAPPTSNLPNDYSVNEKVWAAYVRADFGSADGRLSGNVGVRYVNTRQTSDGYAPDLTQLIFTQQGAQTIVPNVTAVSVKNNYSNWLPSLNVKYELSDNMVLRFGAARVMTRPNINLLSPSTSVNANVRTITQYNPHLRPFLADQLDLSLEYYFGRTGLLSAAVFYKDLKNFVVNTSETRSLTVTQLEGGAKLTFPFTFFAPDNGTGGKLKGLEVGAQVPFTFLPGPLDGFGVIANYTYLDVGALSVTAGGPKLPVPGVSKHSYNLAGYFEKWGFAARVAYNYRSGYTVDASSYFGDGEFVRPYGQIDASLSYDITPNLSLTADVTNLTNSAVKSYDVYDISRGFENVGRRFTVGVHAKF